MENRFEAVMVVQMHDHMRELRMRQIVCNLRPLLAQSC